MSRRERIVGNHYQLGLEIGKGGFGTVFSALDLRNGKSVAIKQVSLIDMAKEELAAIESEIKLLKKLHHENIVKYYNTIKEEDYLYIVLEYMENGSLAQFMKKFGTLSETLVAMYITQVLRGLAYLHAQGVLHRDVKGANILTTKDGLVKIADFGVAIKLNEAQKSNSVVGSPYWMAPEVIEMAGWSSASDIWSVGCTIIELLTQKPPYFDLAPMAALFRIVQDDHPPLPKSISPALHDFIMKCFMKEPRLRLSADDLLLHPWISQIPRTKVEQSTQEVQDNVTSTDDRAAVLNTIRMYDTITRDSTSTCLEAMHEDDDESWDVDLQANAPLKLVKLAATTTSHSTLPTFQLTHDDAHDPFWADEDVPPASSTPSTSTTTTTKTRHDTVGTWGDTSVGHKEGSKLHHFREADNDDGFGDGFEDEDASKGATSWRCRLSSSLQDVRSLDNGLDGFAEPSFGDPCATGDGCVPAVGVRSEEDAVNVRAVIGHNDSGFDLAGLRWLCHGDVVVPQHEQHASDEPLDGDAYDATPASQWNRRAMFVERAVSCRADRGQNHDGDEQQHAQRHAKHRDEEDAHEDHLAHFVRGNLRPRR
ncbi:hypothetical protein AaE_001331 [Aphanomyces astaci]|uniref:Protein kinase domain-containing protein n=1 Tax=Aphanomyces astaci TaxID=112090 RepID=A0A6A5ACR2_APHAT|nr:hypothetical protein AaE_001331 [Aphanomyces astaci]